MISKGFQFGKDNRDQNWKKQGAVCGKLMWQKYENKLGIKQYGNRLKIQLKGCYRMEVNSKAFATTILTGSGLQLTIQQSEYIGIADALEFISVLQQPFSCIFNLFSYYFIANLFGQLFTFNPYSQNNFKLFKSFLVFVVFSCPLSGLCVPSKMC